MILNVGNRRLNFWSKYTVSLRFDSIASSFSFSYYYDNTTRTNTDISAVLDYKKCSLIENGFTLLTGTILNHGFNSNTEKELSSISGYSLPGILNDVVVPPDLYPLQFDGLTLKEITKKLAFRFGIKFIIMPSVSRVMNEVIPQTELGPKEKIGEFLGKMASDRNIILSHSPEGFMIFTKADTEAVSVFDFNGDGIATKKSLSINGQGMYSQITALAESEETPSNAAEETLENPYVKQFRPIVVVQGSGNDTTTKQVARTALGQQLKNIKLTIEVSRWQDKNGNLWQPNTIITVVDPDLKIFKKSKFFVEGVTFVGDENGQTAVLSCVVPEVYSEKDVVSIFRT
jgi:prophage tail gpP-like protein